MGRPKIAPFPEDVAVVEVLVPPAERCLYPERSAGRNRVVVSRSGPAPYGVCPRRRSSASFPATDVAASSEGAT